MSEAPENNLPTPQDVRKTTEQRGFETTGRIADKGGKPFRPLIDRIFSRWVSSAHLSGDWATDADWARTQQDPMRARTLIYLVVITVVALLVWAAFADVASMAKGMGKVVPSGDLKKMASVDGGVVSNIYVKEGDLVHKGQLLMRVDPTRARSKLGENVSKSLALQAKAARLRALVSGTDFKIPDDVKDEAPKLAAHARKLHERNLAELLAAESIAREQLEQSRNALKAAQAHHKQASQALSLSSQELNMTKPLLKTGAVSEVQILRLRRKVSDARGERNKASADIDRLKDAIQEAQSKLNKVDLEKKNEWGTKLSDVLSQLATLREGKLGLQNRVQSTSIRSPVDGIVQKLYVTTIGGVVQPGQEVVSVVPTDDNLIIEAHISPKDIAFLHPGQKAFVTFTAYNYSIYGGMEAELTHISADTITDKRDRTYYIVRLRTLKPTFGDGLTIIPGMTTRVNIQTGHRSVLHYLLQPIRNIKHNALN